MLKLLIVLSVIFHSVRLQEDEHVNYYDNLPYNNARTQYQPLYLPPFYKGDKPVIRKACNRRSNAPSENEWIQTSSWPIKNNNVIAYNPVLESESLMANENTGVNENTQEEQTNVDFYPTSVPQRQNYEETIDNNDDSLIILTKSYASRLLNDCFSHIKKKAAAEQQNDVLNNHVVKGIKEYNSKSKSDDKIKDDSSSNTRRFMSGLKENKSNEPLLQIKSNFNVNENDTNIERTAEDIPSIKEDDKIHTELRVSQVEFEPNLSQKFESTDDNSNKNFETDVYDEYRNSMPGKQDNQQLQYSLNNQELENQLYEPTQGTSKTSKSRLMLMQNSRVCYACSTLSDPSCWNPDRKTTVKYCRRGHEECVTKTFKIQESSVVIRDCATSCKEGLTQYKSCSICHHDLCNSASSPFVFGQLIITIFFIVYNYTF